MHLAGVHFRIHIIHFVAVITTGVTDMSSKVCGGKAILHYVLTLHFKLPVAGKSHLEIVLVDFTDCRFVLTRTCVERARAISHINLNLT